MMMTSRIAIMKVLHNFLVVKLFYCRRQMRGPCLLCRCVIRNLSLPEGGRWQNEGY